MTLYRLDARIVFPDPREAEPDGLLAVGGDLSPARLLLAYSLGIFPWFNEGDPILWWSPPERCVVLKGQHHVSRSLARVIRSGRFEVRFDTAFEAVMRACARPRKGQDGTWISEAMVAAYTALHRAGYAHSVEAWEAPPPQADEASGSPGARPSSPPGGAGAPAEGGPEGEGERGGPTRPEPDAASRQPPPPPEGLTGKGPLAVSGRLHDEPYHAARPSVPSSPCPSTPLARGSLDGPPGLDALDSRRREGRLVGGLYGLSLGAAFFGESMFSAEPDASKVAFAALCDRAWAWDFAFIDAQVETPHLRSLGAVMVDRENFLIRLASALEEPAKVGKWTKELRPGPER